MPDISKWDTHKVTDMSYMFYDCSSLLSLPKVLKWDTHNVTNMSYMFHGCSSLLALPDISKWNTSNVTNMSHLFELSHFEKKPHCEKKRSPIKLMI